MDMRQLMATDHHQEFLNARLLPEGRARLQLRTVRWQFVDLQAQLVCELVQVYRFLVRDV